MTKVIKLSAWVQALGHTDTDGHDQLEFLLHGADRYLELFGDFQVAGAMQAAEDEDTLLPGAQLGEAGTQALEQLFGMGCIFGTALRRGDTLHHVQWHVLEQCPGLHAAAA
ncbi:hypothetical protein D3C85_710950 [compost metagenome]